MGYDYVQTMTIGFSHERILQIMIWLDFGQTERVRKERFANGFDQAWNDFCHISYLYYFFAGRAKGEFGEACQRFCVDKSDTLKTFRNDVIMIIFNRDTQQTIFLR